MIYGNLITLSFLYRFVSRIVISLHFLEFSPKSRLNCSLMLFSIKSLQVISNDLQATIPLKFDCGGLSRL